MAEQIPAPDRRYGSMRHIYMLPTLLAAAAAAFAAPSAAQSADVDFAGKTITIVVGLAPGGGFDRYARLMADHLGKYLPGEPHVIVENMPGGGGLRAAIYVATAAPRDGTVIAAAPTNLLYDGAMGNLPAGIDADDYTFIGRISPAPGVTLTWHTSPTKTIADARSRETTIGATGLGSTTSLVPLAMNAIAGTKFKVVQGYSGTPDTALAMERGEVEGCVQGLETVEDAHHDWLDDDKVNVVFQLSLTRNAAFPDSPAMMEFATTEDDRALVRLIASSFDIGRAFMLPPGVTEEVIAAHRSAFAQMVRDADFVEDLAERKLFLDPADGETVQGLVDAAADSPPSAVKALATIMKGGN